MTISLREIFYIANGDDLVIHYEYKWRTIVNLVIWSQGRRNSVFEEKKRFDFGKLSHKESVKIASQRECKLFSIKFLVFTNSENIVVLGILHVNS